MNIQEDVNPAEFNMIYFHVTGTGLQPKNTMENNNELSPDLIMLRGDVLIVEWSGANLILVAIHSTGLKHGCNPVHCN